MQESNPESHGQETTDGLGNEYILLSHFFQVSLESTA